MFLQRSIAAWRPLIKKEICHGTVPLIAQPMHLYDFYRELERTNDIYINLAQ